MVKHVTVQPARAAAGHQDASNVLGGYGGARGPMTGEVRSPAWAGLPIATEAVPGESYDALRSRAAAKDT